MNGDAVGHPSGLTITAATVAYEDNLMLDVIANQAKAHHLSLIDQVQAPGVFLGYSVGQSRFNSYQTKSVGSSPCNDLMEVSLAVDSFLIGGGVARSSYNQWRGVVQVNKATKRRFIRHQRPGDLLVGGTDFFTILHP
jgi:hypothetical protein